MAKKLNTVQVNMQFNTDTNKAKQQMQELQNSLTKLLNSSTQINIDASKIREATIATTELQAHLKNATNIDTGNLDFSKLSQSLKKSGKTLQEYGNQLRNLGPQGQQAFMQLTQAVVSAEVPIKRTNALLKEFANTLANTARWQISSSIIHGFTGALQSAYGYAQDLNESLNNIRIVTGRSVNDMADFAKEANKAARALSTTTTKYTDASLIYYQQGLGDKEVKERADVTIKLANVSRQSAQEVSEQMTAIWNNFYDGSKSLSHYADVLSALGAATASSTEEIAGGLEKFAAVADTIGLSYEYAAAALATITSNTRQSEEVVGTALKTIFARIQGLNLGETLEDGTTLNKYSEALDKVGVNIYDANKQLKDMDTILNELGGKWNSLGKDQQVALAQTVAGVRQYNQLIALMDNWNKGDSDSFKTNLSTANNAAGELNKQADIYAEGWEAAADRVTAAAEAIYDSLINDEFFVDLLNNVEKLLGFVNNLIEGLGGLKGVLFSLGAVITKVFSQQMAQGLTNLAYNIKMSTERGRKQVQQEKSDFIKDAAIKMAKSADSGEAGYDQKKAAELYEQQLLRQQELIDNADKMSEIEKETTKSLMEQLKLRDELAIKSAEEVQKQRDALDASAALIYSRGAETAAEKHRKYNPALITDEMIKIKAGVSGANELQKLLNSETSVSSDAITQVFAKINGDPSKGWNIVNDDQISQIKKLSEGIDGLGQDTDQYREKVQILSGIMKQVNENIQKHAVEITGATADEIKNYATNVERVTQATEKYTEAAERSKKTNEDLQKTIRHAKGAQQEWADTLVAGASAATSLASALSTIGGMWDVLEAPDLSGWEKFTTILANLGTLALTLTATWTAFKTLLKSETAEKIRNAAATFMQLIMEKKLNKEKNKSSEKTKVNTKEKLKNTGSNLKEKVSGGWNKIKNGWNETAYKLQGGTINKNGTSSLKGTKGILSKAKTSELAANAGKTMGGYAAGAAVAAALIAVAVVSYKNLEAQLNKNETTAKKAEEAAKKLAKAYSEVQAKYDNLLNTISNYDNAKKSLDNLTKGTVDFTKAVQDANAEAIQLLETYGDIIGSDYSFDENGLIQIDDKALERIKAEEYAEVQDAQLTSQLANRKAREARITADMTKLNREKIKSREGFTSEDVTETHQGAAVGLGVGAAAGLGAAAAGMAIGATAGSAVPVIGTIIGAVAGLVIGGVTGAIVNAIDENSETDKEKEAFKKLEEAYREKGEMVFDDAQIKEMFKAEEYGNLADELIENKDAVKELVKEMAANTAAIEAENIAASNSILSSNDKVQNSQFASQAGVFVADTYKSKTDEYYNTYTSENTKGAWFGLGTDAQKKNWEAYAKQTGIDQKKGYKVKYYKGDGNVVYEYLDEQGKKQEATITREEIASTLASKNVEDDVNAAGEKVVEILNSLDESSVNILSGAKMKDMSALSVNELTTAATTQLSGMTKEELEALGFVGDSRESIIAGIQDQLNKNIKDIKDFANRQSDTIGSIFGGENGILSAGGVFGEVSQIALKQYAETLDKLQASSSEDTITTFNSGMSQLLTQYSHKADEITQIANSIDWTKGDAALQEFNYQLMQMGINVDETGSAWTALGKAMDGVHLSVLDQDLNAIRNSLTEIAKLTKDLDLGDIISDEDYEKLIKYNSELEKYFIMTANGYKYIGGADINSIVNNSHKEQLNDILTGNNKARAAAASFDNVTWSDGTKEDWYGLASGTDSDAKMVAMAEQLAVDPYYSEHLKTIGTSPESLSEYASVLNDPTSSIEQKNEARNKLKAFYQKIITLKDKVKAGDYDDNKAHEIIASGMSLNELQKANYLTPESRSKMTSYLQEAADADRDVFRDVNNELEDIQHNLSLVDKLKENAFGPEHLGFIKQEVQLLQNEVQTLKNKKELLGSELEDARLELSNDYSWLQFDADGNILNYDDLYKYLSEDKWNGAKEAFAEYEELQRKEQDNDLELLDLRNQIQAKTLETYEAADEALEKYNDKLEHHTKTLGHYKDLLVLTGRETDYDNLGIVLEGEASVLKDTLASSTEQYRMYNEEVTRWATQMAQVDEGSEEWKIYHQNWEDAQVKSREAQDKMLSDLQAWAEAEKAIVENTLADLGKDLEKALTGGLSFDQLNTQMERAVSLQEEYLTSTNQIYETTKLMRTAQQEIDKSTNAVAKQKMKSFINETKALQNQGKLSKFELELQQAKYDLLVAEIALEEAQNAKNIVRLQRDAEGNFGYVYTADAALVSESLQQFDDAQNALYNKGLEAANNYAEKYKSTMQEMTEALTEINTNYLNGMYESEEEYHNAMLATKDHYYQKLNDYSKLYSIAIEADSEIAATAWSVEFASMVNDTKNWQESVNTYISGSGKALKGWQGTVKSVYEAIGLDGGTLDTLATKVSNIKTASSELVTALTGKDGLVSQLKTGFGQVAQTITDAIDEFEGLSFDVSIKANKQPTTPSPSDNGNNGNNSGGSSSSTSGSVSGDSIEIETPEEEPELTRDEKIINAAVEYVGNPYGETYEIGTLYYKLGDKVVSVKTVRNPNRVMTRGGSINNPAFGIADIYSENGGAAIATILDDYLCIPRGDGTFERIDISGFKTGGYTGEWGPEGKMAMLHEKEIVLNQQDTANFLMAIDMLDNILATIDSYTMNQMLGGFLQSPGYGNLSTETLEQNVHIEASFPGVTDRNEIEEAFNNLVNKASQYANRK